MNKQLKRIFFACSLIILTVEFYNNVFNLVNQGFFRLFQKDSESLVIGRLYRSKINGPFSYGGFMGWNHPDESLLPANTVVRDARFDGWGYNVPRYPSKFFFQYAAFQNDFKVDHYEVYYSQCGGQSFLYYLLGSVLHISGDNLVACCRMLNAIFTASVLCGFLWWASCYFSFFSAVVGFCVMFFSQWLIVYANNMLYAPGMFFLPFVVNLLAIHYQNKKGKFDQKQISILTFSTILLKCILVGFDFIIPTLVMAVIPLVFYAIVYGWSVKRTFSFLVVTSLVSLAAVCIGLSVLAFQLRFYHNSWAEAIDYLVKTSERRTYGNQQEFGDIFTSSRNISLSHIFYTYSDGDAIDLRYLASKFHSAGIQIKFGLFLGVIVLASLCVPLSSGDNNKRMLALATTTWLSLTGVLGWFVIFKYHSISHTHMNFIIWYMPFMLLGGVLTGQAAYQCLVSLWTKIYMNKKEVSQK